MPVYGTPPPPPQQDVPVHQRTIDFANQTGSGFKQHRDMKDKAQENAEGMEHERGRQDVPSEHNDVSSEQQRLESPEQHHTDAINQGKYGEGFKTVDSAEEQSQEEEQEISM